MSALKTITVRELIEALRDQDPDAPVVFSSNYGDRACTQQVHALRGHVEEVAVTSSAYSDSGFAVDDEPDNEDYEPHVLIK